MEIDDDPFLSREELEQKAALFLKAYNWLEHPVERMSAAFSLFDIDFSIETNPLFLPSEPGVYVFYSEDDLLYVGKSKNLKARCSRHDKPCTDHIGFGVCVERLISLREVQLISVLRPLWNCESKDATDVGFFSQPTKSIKWSYE